jgi:hypothetical protein
LVESKPGTTTESVEGDVPFFGATVTVFQTWYACDFGFKTLIVRKYELAPVVPKMKFTFQVFENGDFDVKDVDEKN